MREMEPAASVYNKIVAFSNATVKGDMAAEDATFMIPEAMGCDDPMVLPPFRESIHP